MVHQCTIQYLRYAGSLLDTRRLHKPKLRISTTLTVVQVLIHTLQHSTMITCDMLVRTHLPVSANFFSGGGTISSFTPAASPSCGCGLIPEVSCPRNPLLISISWGKGLRGSSVVACGDHATFKTSLLHMALTNLPANRRHHWTWLTDVVSILDKVLRRYSTCG